MIVTGIDIGSRNSKLVCWDNNQQKIVFKAHQASGVNPVKAAENLLLKAKEQLKLTEINFLTATGYGRKLINCRYVSEISCHAKGVVKLNSTARTIIDIGGQDSKVISVGENGNVIEFAMNDKCAAGTGSFLEKIALLFEITPEEVGKLALKAQNNLDISSTCVVFAESEIISLINNNHPKESILRGVIFAVAQRVRNLISTIDWQAPVVLTGGVSLNPAIKKAFEEILSPEIIVAKEPLYTGALGAALFNLNQ